MIPHAGQVLYSSAADQNGAVLLQVVTFAGNVNRTLLLVGKADSRDFTKRRVGLLGRGRRYRKAYAALLRTLVQNRALGLERFAFSAFFDKLVDCRHSLFLLELFRNISATASSRKKSCSFRIRGTQKSALCGQNIFYQIKYSLSNILNIKNLKKAYKFRYSFFP